MTEALRFDIFAKDEFSKNFNKLKSHLPSVRNLALGAAAGISAISASLFAIAKTTATAYDKLGKFANQTGLTTEFLSKMNVAAEFTDINIKTMNKSLEYLQVKIGEAAKGIGEGRETLEEFGIELYKNNGILKTTEDMLPELADKFQAMTSATERSEAAQKLFGQRGIAMVKILREGREGLKKYADEAEAMGLVIDEKAAANAAKFNDALYKVRGTLMGLRNEIGERIIPVITGLSEKFTDFIKNNKEEIITLGVTWAGTMGHMIEVGAKAVAALNDSWRGLEMLVRAQAVTQTATVETAGKGVAWLTKQAQKAMNAMNWKGIFDKWLVGSKNFRDGVDKTTDKIGDFREQAQFNLQELLDEGLSIAKADTFIERIKAAIKGVTLLGEAEVENAEKKIELGNYELEEEARLAGEIAKIQEKKAVDAKKSTEARTEALSKMAKVGRALGKEMFMVSKAVGIAEATMDTHKAVAKAIKNPPGPPWSFAYGAAALAYGMAQVASIASQTYAHGGMTNVPREQTVTVTEGERIISPAQNKDLTDFMAGAGGMGNGVVIENINILPNATNAEMLLDMRQDDWEEIVENNILPALKSLDNRGFAIS